MTIINEIDKENPKSNRTIDTETGVYLKYIKANGWERIAMFVLSDSGANIHLNVFFSNKLDEEKKTNDYYYQVSIGFLEGTPRRKNYADLIRRLFDVHGWQCRAEERRFGNKEVVKLDFKPEALDELSKWENSNDV